MKNAILQSIVLTVCLVLGGAILGHAKSYYYHEDFTNWNLTNNGWNFDFHMGRDILVQESYGNGGNRGYLDPNYPAKAVITNFGGQTRMAILGRPNQGQVLWNNWYLGDGAKFDPTKNSQLGNSVMKASPEEPFGFTIIRYQTSVDAYGNCAESNFLVTGQDVPDANYKGFISVWMAEDNTASIFGDRWDNFAFFYDKGYAQNYNLGTNTWGYYNQIEYDSSIANTYYDIDGSTVGALRPAFARRYDENNHRFTNSIISRASGHFNPVTDELGIRMTHNGSKITIYLNPDPMDNTAGVNNAWFKFAEIPASGWNSNLIAYIANETGYFITGYAEALFDHFLIRTVASNIVAEISPERIVTNTNVQFCITVTTRRI